MKKKKSLFELVHSMSRAEKRYFTLDARKSGRDHSRYLQLFQAINAQGEYNEAELQKKFGRKLTDDKGRLYEAILRSMRDYRSNRSLTARVKELILDVNFLYERGLYDQANMRLENARKIAKELEDYPSILEINRESRRLLNTLTSKNHINELSKLEAEAENTLKILSLEFNFLNFHDELLSETLSRKIGKTIQSDEDLINRYDTSLFSEDEPNSLQSQIRFYQSKAMYSSLLNDKEKTYQNYKKVVSYWNQNLAYKQEEFNRYLNDAFNLLFATLNYPPVLQEARNLLNHLSEEQPISAHDQAVLFQRTSIYKIYYAINYEPESPADEILNPIYNKINQFDLNPASKLVILFNGAILYFIQDKSDKCEYWLQEIIESKKNYLRQDLNCSSRLLRLLCLIDQDMPIELLDSAFRSEQRSLSKINDDRLVSFGQWLIKSLKTYLNTSFSLRSNLLRDYQKTTKKDWSNLPLEFDQLVLAWFESKEKNQPMLKIMKS